MIRSRVLIVEDESDIRRFVRMALEQEGLDTCEASTAREARMYASSSKPDLVIVDLGLPDDDGKTFIRELREWSTVPVIVLSARQQEVEKVAALDAGADDYLPKPFGVPELLARARAQLRRAAFVSAKAAISTSGKWASTSRCRSAMPPAPIKPRRTVSLTRRPAGGTRRRGRARRGTLRAFRRPCAQR